MDGARGEKLKQIRPAFIVDQVPYQNHQAQQANVATPHARPRQAVFEV
jgi:hypothetical protein